MQKVTETKSNFSLASLNFHLWWVLILLASLNNPNTCLGHNHQHNKQYASLFIFGDSLFDPGNNNYINTTNNFRANFWPYGESFFRYPTGRSSDGRLIPDFIAEYAKLPLIPPYLQPGHYNFAYGANFASAGAGALVESFSGMVVDLKTQLSYFKKVEKQLKQQLGDQEAKQMLSNAVYLFSIGNNDYLSPFLSNSSTFFHSFSQKEYIKMVIGNFTDVINDVYKSGGRKFGILSVLPLGCIPSIKALKPGNNCMAEVTDLAKLHNKALSENLKNLEKHLKGFKYSYFDLYTAASDRMDNPLKYGFKEGKIACCGTGPYRGVLSCGGKREVKEFELCDNAIQYLFFDSTHPSEIANHQFAHLMWGSGGGGGGGLLPNVTGPYNLKSLFEITLEPSIEEP